MKHLPTLTASKELVTSSFFQAWVSKINGNQESDWVTTHQMVKHYWYGGDEPKYTEWASLTDEVFKSCIVIAMNETK